MTTPRISRAIVATAVALAPLGFVLATANSGVGLSLEIPGLVCFRLLGTAKLPLRACSAISATRK